MLESKLERKNDDVAALPTDDAPDGVLDVQAWEQIESGRFMPRRIRGSFRGRALG